MEEEKEILGGTYTHDTLYDTFMMEEWRISTPASFLTVSQISLMAFTALLSMPAGYSTHLSLPYEVAQLHFLGPGLFLFQSQVWKIKVIVRTPSKPVRFRNSLPEERSGMLNQYILLS